MANDRVLEQAIALLNSIRCYDVQTPVMLIPYDDQYHQVAQVLAHHHGVTVYKDLPVLKRLDRMIIENFGDRFFARPQQFRKQACWFGPFDQFLYLDTDIVVFEPIIQVLDSLMNADFVCCDYQHKTGINMIFSPALLQAHIFKPEALNDVFNCGFWGSKKHLMTEDSLVKTLAECAAHLSYFDFSHKTSDQPILNYLVLTQIARRVNLAQQTGGAGSWAGSPQFQILQPGNFATDGEAERGDRLRLFDPTVNQPLRYLHWAGMQIAPGCPYWEVWSHYRYGHSQYGHNQSKHAPAPSPLGQPKGTWLSRMKKQLKALIDR